MTRSFFNLISVLDLGCWAVCFWWMHRISVRQNTMLEELQQQARRIHDVSKEEHEILKEIHPAVQKIGEGVDQVKNRRRAEGRGPFRERRLPACPFRRPAEMPLLRLV